MSVTQTYTVSGMTCGHCVQAVTSELTGLTGVRDVQVDLTTGAVTVASDAPLPTESVRAAIDEAGYELGRVSWLTGRWPGLRNPDRQRRTPARSGRPWSWRAWCSRWSPASLPGPARETTVDGQRVSYEGTPRVGATEEFTFQVSSGGGPSLLEPYLGTSGHLVMLRAGDLGYVHVHPADASGAPPGTVRFWLAVPSAGRYRLFLDFKVAGVVRTAEFTLTVP